jgi:hypothetical protein
LPLRENPVRGFDLRCANPRCVHGASLLADVDGVVVAAVCLNDSGLLLDKVRASEGASGHCVACRGEAPNTVRLDDGAWEGVLCRGHAIAYVARALTPEAFEAVCEDAGGDPERVFALHHDFYEDGFALQPIALGAEQVQAYVDAMEELPGFDEEGDYDYRPEDIAELVRLMKQGFLDYAGVEIDDNIADHMIGDIVMFAGFEREQRFVDRVAGFRPVMLERALKLYAQVDPQGLVALHGAEPNPYENNARDLVRRMWGEEQERYPNVMLQRVLQSFGDPGMDLSSVTPQMAELAVRVARDVAHPAWLYRKGEWRG